MKRRYKYTNKNNYILNYSQERFWEKFKVKMVKERLWTTAFKFSKQFSYFFP